MGSDRADAMVNAWLSESERRGVDADGAPVVRPKMYVKHGGKLPLSARIVRELRRVCSAELWGQIEAADMVDDAVQEVLTAQLELGLSRSQALGAARRVMRALLGADWREDTLSDIAPPDDESGDMLSPSDAQVARAWYRAERMQGAADAAARDAELLALIRADGGASLVDRLLPGGYRGNLRAAVVRGVCLILAGRTEREAATLSGIGRPILRQVVQELRADVEADKPARPAPEVRSTVRRARVVRPVVAVGAPDREPLLEATKPRRRAPGVADPAPVLRPVGAPAESAALQVQGHWVQSRVNGPVWRELVRPCAGLGWVRPDLWRRDVLAV